MIRGGAIGDFILTLPVLEAIRRNDDAAEVEVLGYPAIAEMVVGRRLADAARRVDGVEWAALFSASGELAETEREYIAGFDRVVCVWPDSDNVIRENLARAGARDVVHADPIPPQGDAIHAARFVARQCERAGLRVETIEPRLYPSERDRWWTERFMRVTCAGERPLLGMHVGSGSPKKNWPAERFAEVARQWVARRPGHVLLVAGPADDPPLEKLAAPIAHDAVFLLRNEALPRVAAALERCEAFVGNDSGIAHMAAAVRTPTVVLFGPTDPEVWRPLGPKVTVLTPQDRREGLAGIPTDEVIRAVGIAAG